MKHPVLVAEERTTLGKKVKKLRREGLLPTNVYGKDLPSRALQVKTEDFRAVYKEVGETGLIDLTVDGKSKPVLIKNLQMNYQTHTPLHVDFYQVNLKEKIKSMIPLTLLGEPQAVVDKAGILLQTLSEVEVEALPEALPEKLEVSVEALAAVGDQVTVENLTVPEGVVVLTDPTQTVAKIAELIAEEPEPEVEATEEGAEGEESTTEEGETKEETTEETPADDKKEE